MVDATPMRNEDFRKLLATPRAGQQSRSTPSATPSRKDADAKKKPYKPRPKPTAAAEADDDDGPKYRDRAEERRRGVNPDYASANQLLRTIGTNGDVNVAALSVEDSKYLGGDLEHTHLVKGLDYALLQKTKSQIEKQQGGDEDQDDAAASADGRTAHKVVGGGAAKQAKREEVVAHNPIAKGVLNTLFPPIKSLVYEQFMPRRMAFVYEFEADEFGVVPDIPTTVRRSKADCPQVAEAVFARVDNQVLERIAKIMSYVKTVGGKKVVKRKDKDDILGELKQGAGAAQQAPGAGVQPGPGPQAGTAAGPQSQQGGAQRQQPKPADEEEDIFGDAGTDYKPSVSGKKKAPQEQQQQGGGGDDMELEEGEAPPDQPQAGAGNYGPAPPTGVYADPYAVQQHYGQYPDPYGGALPAWPEAAAAGYPPAPGYPPPPPQAEAQQQQQQQQREDVPKWRVRTRKAEERMVDYVDDAYGEFYQLAGGFEVPTLDDDDDVIIPSKKGAPGAAAKSDGPKSEKEAARADAQKTNTQLQKIEAILKEKGHDHSGAFGRTPGRKVQTGEDPSLAGRDASKKQRRI